MPKVSAARLLSTGAGTTSRGIYGGGVRPVGVQDYGMPASTLRVNLQGLRDTQELTRKAKRDAAVAQCKDYLTRVCDPRFVEGQPDLRYYIWERTSTMRRRIRAWSIPLHFNDPIFTRQPIPLNRRRRGFGSNPRNNPGVLS